MKEEPEFPVLTDLIERGGEEIKMSDLGLDDELIIEDDATNLPPIDALGNLDEVDPFLKAALEQSIRRILDEHMELAMQEIKLVIQRELDKHK